MQTTTHTNGITLGVIFLLAAGTVALAAELTAAPGPAGDVARQILAPSGVKGGLVVHLGCGDGRLTAALRANDSYLVHGLDADAANVEKARQYIHARGLYGPVSVEQYGDGRLPYNDNLVNLVVAEDLAGEKVSMDEVMRVLAPGGVACMLADGRWTKTVKPRPAEIDQWTHYLHDPSNNAVSHDSVVGVPRRMQWIGGPRYSRHHDHMSSISAMVSASGRNFCIFDEGPTASILVPPKWSLIARDAFNGTILWKRPIPEWHTTLWPLKSGPQLLTRRLVAVGERVYATLGSSAPLVALDAATGATVRTYDGTAGTEEILCADAALFLVVNPRHEPQPTALGDIQQAARLAWPDEGRRRILALAADSGRTVWEKIDRILPETLTVESGRVFYHDGEKVVCLNRADGAQSWASPPLAHKSVIVSHFTPTLVAYKDVILFSGGVDTSDVSGAISPLVALSAASGEILWQADQPHCGHHTPKDVLVANGLVWYGEVAVPTDSGMITGRDPATGKVVKQYPPDVNVPWFHHRCYRAKATDNYLLFSRTGIECIDTSSGHWTPNNWVRGGCLYGIMPANGMIYTPPHPCACYAEAKLDSFCALAPEGKAESGERKADEASRLERGPAYGQQTTESPAPDSVPVPPAATGGLDDSSSLIPHPSSLISSDDWPTYRHDAARSGSTKTSVPSNLKSVWQADVGGRLSSVVIADGKLFVSSIDIHTVLALDAGTGKIAWRYTAGGRVDSPPTIWQGRVLFGSADGYVYCLRASDGALAWRYLAAPEDRRLVAYNQVESVWPVPGNVLVADGVAYCIAGRSMFLDGGLRLLRLDPVTGRKLSETVLDDRNPRTNENLQSLARQLDMPVALPDVLSCDGRYVYMRSLPFDLQGERKYVDYQPVNKQEGDDVHLFSPTGFLDSTMWHRTYWVYGRAWASGAGGYFKAGRLVPAGRIMVFDDTTVWGYGRRWQFYRWSTPYVYHLFATSKKPEILPTVQPVASGQKSPTKAIMHALQGAPPTRFAYDWSDALPVQVLAMVHAGQTLFVAGPPNFVNETKAAASLDDPQTRAKLAKQGEALDGLKGGILTAVSAADGAGLASYRLDSAPVFDGMAAADGTLYLSTTDGKILCLGGHQGKPLKRIAGDAVVQGPPDAD